MTRGPRYISPLRYPGGKARMARGLGQILARQTSELGVEVWYEPFAGGAGAALTMLDRGLVGEAWLVEKNPALAALWRTILTDGERLARQVERTRADLATWDWAGAEVAEPTGDDLALARAALVLNRCSRSGIVAPGVGPIGGRAQTGPYTLDARFNAPALADRIRHIAQMPGLRFTEGDAVEHVTSLTGSGIEDEVMIFLDPPYVREGNRLYACGMDEAGHQALADALNACPAPWLLTYDDHPSIAETLYPQRRVVAYEMGGGAARARTAVEHAVLSDNLDVDTQAPALLPGGRSWWLRERPAPPGAGSRPVDLACETIKA